MNKILIIDLCLEKKSLHYNEFVIPVVDIVRSVIKEDYNIFHFKELDSINYENFNKIILCGTALKDFEYLSYIDKFSFLKDFMGDVLGICAGSQIIGKVFDCSIEKGCEIGLVNIEILKNDKIFEKVDFSEVYCLHNSYVKVNDKFDILAKTKDYTQVFKLKNKKIYGVLFHPEVRNKDMIKRFVLL